MSDEINEYSNSTDEKEVYIPTKENNEELEYDSTAYSFLEEISLEWPSQSVTFISKNALAIGQNADNETSSSIILLDIKNIKQPKKVAEISNTDLNKIEFHDDVIYGCGDNVLIKINKNLEVTRKDGKFCYGFAVKNSNIYVGGGRGEILIFDKNLKQKKALQIHSKEINSIKVTENYIYSCGNDCYLKIFCLKKNKVIYKKKFKSDLNSLDVNLTEETLICGEENGNINVLNLKNKEIEVIKWHKSPISYLLFSLRENDVFYSCCYAQVCLWDISLEDDWEYHKYLYFVHAGGKDYKQILEKDDMLITTSYDGLTLFTPIDDGSD